MMEIISCLYILNIRLFCVLFGPGYIERYRSKVNKVKDKSLYRYTLDDVLTRGLDIYNLPHKSYSYETPEMSNK